MSPLLALRALRAAVTFLTRVPVGGHPFNDAEFRWSSAWFPAVGALLGLVYAGVWTAAEPLGAPAAAALVLVAALLVTGAFHEDGLADTADALGGGYSRERVLEILKDSRIGAFGAAALVVALLLRAALLVRLGPDAPLALVLAECGSRVPGLWLRLALPYLTRDAHARSLPVACVGWGQAIAGTAMAAALAATGAGLGWWSTERMVAVAGAATAAGLVCAWRFHARLGGITGDFLGANQQITVCALLAVLAWR
jgi:adenosylcobinamide-GDP ribazoletransferase